MDSVTSARVRAIAADCLEDEGYYSQAMTIDRYTDQYDALAAALLKVRDLARTRHSNDQLLAAIQDAMATAGL